MRQEKACGALLNLTANHAANKAAVGAVPGLWAAVIAGMRAHRASEPVQEQACGLLRNLAVTNQNAIAAAGGIEALVSAATVH